MVRNFFSEHVPESDQIYAKGPRGCRHPLVTVCAENTFFCMRCYENTRMYLLTDPYIQSLLKDVTISRDVAVDAKKVHAIPEDMDIEDVTVKDITTKMSSLSLEDMDIARDMDTGDIMKMETGELPTKMTSLNPDHGVDVTGK